MKMTTVNAGPDNDTIDGGFGISDIINGDGGYNYVSYQLSGNPVIVDLYNYASYDYIVNDILNNIQGIIGSLFDDILIGDNARNIIDGGQGGADQIVGGGGSDTVSYGTSSRSVIIDLAAQLTWDGVVNDTLSSIENAIGSAFDDTFLGDGRSILDGGSGGADAIDGGNGTSGTVSHASSASPVVIDLNAQLTWDGTSNDRLNRIYNAVGSAFDDVIFGGVGNNVLDGGNGGADQIFGVNDPPNPFRPGNVTGQDTVSYASSDRSVIINLNAGLTWDGVNNDELHNIQNAIGSRGDDILFGNDGNNILDGGSGGADQIFGAGGLDQVSYASSSRGVVVDMNANLTWDGVNNDTLNSVEGAIGSAQDDQFFDGAGNGTYSSGGGNDKFLDGSGFDTYIGGLSGFEVVSYENNLSSITYQFTLGEPFPFSSGPSLSIISADGSDRLISIDYVIGTQYDDTFYVTVTDRFDAGLGTDTVVYDSYPVQVNLDAGTVIGGITSDASQVRSITGIENVTGSNGADRIEGAREVANVLAGRGGSDTFAFTRGAGADTITDFNVGDVADKLLFQGYGTAEQGANFVQIDPTHYAINSGDGQVQDVITFSNAPSIDTSQWTFVA